MSFSISHSNTNIDSSYLLTLMNVIWAETDCTGDIIYVAKASKIASAKINDQLPRRLDNTEIYVPVNCGLRQRMVEAKEFKWHKSKGLDSPYPNGHWTGEFFGKKYIIINDLP